MEEVNIYNHRDWVSETNPELLVKQMNRLLELSGYTVVNFVEHHFQPQGYTSIWLLAESHLAVHTFPEQNKTYIELSGCKKSMNELFVIYLEQIREDFMVQIIETEVHE